MNEQPLSKSKKFKNIKPKLPKISKEQVLFAKTKLGKFPNIFRFITERPSSNTELLKQSAVVFTAMLVIGVALVSCDLFITLAKTAYDKVQYAKLQEEKVYWQQVNSKYPNYKDADIQLAVILYRLGEKEPAKMYLQKAILLDPNDKTVVELAKEITE